MTDLTASTVLADALAAHKPALAQYYTASVERRFANLVQRFGSELRGVYNSDVATLWQSIARLAKRVNKDQVLDAELVAAAAKEFADATVASWQGKIQSKLGELEEASVSHLDGYRFQICGLKAGRKVRIEQDMILNFSSKGTPFNQFPARIYVDGKFTPAAKYAAL
jgi:hypothetical protein